VQNESIVVEVLAPCNRPVGQVGPVRTNRTGADGRTTEFFGYSVKARQSFRAARLFSRSFQN